MELESAACCEVHIPEKTGATVVKPAAAAAASGGRGRKRRQHTVVAAAATAAAAEKDSSSSSAANSLDPVDDWEREELFREQWALIEAKLLEETSAFFGRYVRLLVDFIGRHCGHDDGQSEERYHQQVGFNFGMLPVALIALNSKMTQSRVHAEVEEMLKTKDSSSSSSNIHRLCLNSFNLASMSALLQALFNGLISDEVCEENDLDGGHWKNMSVDEVIELWFDSNSSAKGKDQKSSSSPPPPSLVLFVFDFETVNKQTLLTLILLLKEHTHRAAISMVFFLASSHNARSMQYYLPAQATDHLAFEELEPFYEPALIPRLLEALVVDESLHFRLHPTMLRQLAAHTTNYEFTFANFFLLLKSLVFEHFYADPLSVVCQEPRSLKATLMKELAAAAASSKSRQSLLPLLQNSLPLAAAAESDQAEEDSSADTEDGGDNDKAYICRLTAQLEELHSQHARFTLALQIVIDLLQYAHCLPVKSTQNTTRSSSSTTAAAAAAAVKISSTAFLDHYCDAVTEPAYNFEEGLLSELLERLSESSAKLALKRLLAKYRDVEEEVEEKEELIALLAEYQTKLAELQRQEAEEEARQQEHSKKLGLEIDMVRSVTVVKEKLRAVQSRTEWRQTLSSSSSAQKKTKAKKNLLPFEQWKTELVGALAEALRAASPATRRRHRLLAEALFARAAVERHFREVHCVCTRDRLARTLSQTGGGGGGGGSSGSRSHSFATCYPNSFILYQLYREAAPVVNLADWYEQFGEEKRRQGQQQQTQQQPGSSKKGGKEAAAAAAAEGLSADELTVHFSTTLSDFDYIGLLQSSRYKADYLNRLAWF